MGQVLIIKNKNDSITEYARFSFEKSVIRYYNSLNNSVNENALKKMKEMFRDNGIILMLNYADDEFKEISEIYIGDAIKINDENNIEYRMWINLAKENNENVIESIVDKVDLDVDEDYRYGEFVILNEMESLYQELRDRILSRKQDGNNIACSNEIEDSSRENDVCRRLAITEKSDFAPYSVGTGS